MVLLDAHVDRCRSCEPTYFPTGRSRRGEHHFAVRLGDGREHVRVLLNGVYLAAATEVLAGVRGQVWYLVMDDQGQPHQCACGSGLWCEAMDTGIVTVHIERVLR